MIFIDKQEIIFLNHTIMKFLTYLFYLIILFGCISFLFEIVQVLGWLQVVLIFLACNFVSNTFVGLYELLKKDFENQQ